MAHGKRYSDPIPKGYQVYESRVEPAAGWKHHKADMVRFAKMRKHKLFLERDRGNKHDPNAIRVVGSKGVMLGYLPRDIAAKLVLSKTFDAVRIRMQNVYLSDSGYVTVEFDLLGPKGRIDKYRSVEVPSPTSTGRVETPEDLGWGCKIGMIIVATIAGLMVIGWLAK